MTRHVAFFILLTVSSLYAAIRGGRPEQIGAATLFGGAWASVLAANPPGGRFRQLESGILVIDIVLLAIFLWLAIRSTRFWPIWVAGLLGSEVLVHVGVILAPLATWRAYLNATAMWSWVAQIILIVATWRHRERLAQRGNDASWKG
ncbi:hypothetical protein [Novosphingobium sp. KACC 22771]|uniref:hypothetical protein n=1 Tax=Novosphingobium sp. KACC 22771 TaxID=3025670 RepID=UPI0023670ADB|nr:hypothetical protein [Novosphingobium sp. KACC 22771]WDF74214.1 hypothetical protein PQ467_19865 [Novosphingobium sp. KACC 22771]